jgi:hypothetical protein
MGTIHLLTRTASGLVEIEYHDVADAARMLHVSESTVRKQCRAKVWPHTELLGRYYLSNEQVADVVDALTCYVDPRDPRPGEPEPPPKLGVPLSDVDAEPIR